MLSPMRELMPRTVAASVDELLADVTRRESWAPAETRSGTQFERVWVGDEALLVKYLHLDDDFTMRASGDIGARSLRAFAAGLYDVAPEHIDHGIVGMAGGVGRNGWGSAVLMRDLSGALATTTDAPWSEAEHEGFVNSMAAMCAATWRWEDDLGLLPYEGRWQFFGPAALEGERCLGWPEPVPRLSDDGWHRFAERVPSALATAIQALRGDVTPLTDRLAETPSCFLHGDWKNGNLGRGPDGRTVLIDWVYLGAGPACHELCWYLALNRSKLPEGRTKEDVIDEFRDALAVQGVDRTGWFDRQLALCLTGALVQFGWEKAFGDADELGWWCDHAAEGLALL